MVSIHPGRALPHPGPGTVLGRGIPVPPAGAQ